MLAEEIPPIAASKGIGSALLADRMTVSGAHEFDKLARKVGIKALLGATFEMPEGGEIVLIAQNSIGWRSLSRLVTECHLDESRLFPICNWERLSRHSAGLLCLTGGSKGPINQLLMARNYSGAEELLLKLQRIFPTFLQMERSHLPWEKSVNAWLEQLAEKHQLMCVAGGTHNLGKREHYPVQDMLLCIESLCAIDEVIGRKPQRDPSQPPRKPIPLRGLNAETFIKSPNEFYDLYQDHPDWIENTLRVAELCDRDVLPGLAPLPHVFDDDNAALQKIVMDRARQIRPQMPTNYRRRIGRELASIIQLGFANHFLIAWEMCEWAREQNILFSGRGSVVDSAIAYCLG
ncbi:MAG TPA: PHP domain-containing protein, partial [Nitrospira sp.]|nr:PHP domain-containing protein [Nitrospira sp.]